MKLHLPVKLMRAVMAVLVSHAVVSTAWAEAVTIPEGYTLYPLSELPAQITTGVAVLLSQDGAVNLESGIILKGNHFFASADQAGLCDLTWQPGTDAVVVNGNVDFCWLDNLSFSNGENLQSNETYLDVSSGYGNNGSLSIHNVTDVSVSGAHSVGHGAFSVSGDVVITDNTEVSFNGNAAVFSKESDTTQTLGGALCGFGNITLTNNEILKFSGNTSASKGHTANGGAIGISTGGSGEASIKVSDNAAVIFSDNSSVANGNAACGGAITTCHTGIDVQFTGNESVVFDGNSATSTGANSAGGGALYSYDTITLSQNGSVTFSDNYVSNGVEVEGDILPDTNPIEGIPTACGGGAILALSGDVVLKDNTGAVVFSGNYAQGSFTSSYDTKVMGGAIGTFFGGDVVLSGDSNKAENTGDTLSFTNNSVSSDVSEVQGGAIYSGGAVLISDFSKVEFSGNKAISTKSRVEGEGGSRAQGGAIYSTGAVIISDNGDVSFTDNGISSNGSADGGAIYGSGYVAITGNNDVTFSGNLNYSESLYANCIEAVRGDADGNAITIKGNNNVVFESNISHATNGIYGGVLHTDANEADVLIAENRGNVKFNGNAAIADTAGVCASVIESLGGGIKILNNDGCVEICNNSAVANDLVIGATMFAASGIWLDGNGGVLLEGNVGGSKKDAIGGVLLALLDEVSISDNRGEVIVRGNGVGSTSDSAQQVYGGAIVAYNGLSIVNNSENVTFEGNFEVQHGEISLRSIYVEDGGVELSAVEGKSITFYDSITIESGSGASIALNSYTDNATNEKMLGTGSIVFSGAKTEEGLQAAQKAVADFVGIPEEYSSEIPVNVETSRFSTIARNVSVEAGSLQVIDGALLGLLDDEGAPSYELTVGDAELLLSAGSGIGAGEIIFSEQSSLVLQGSETPTFSLEEASVSSALLVAMNNITLTAGMSITVDGAYADLMDMGGVEVDVSNGKSFILNLKESSAIERDGKLYYVIFTGATSLEGATWDDVKYEHNLTNYEDVTMGYHAGTGTLYISATAPIPEPTTATLSLLALAGLAARRRRK